jgi:hypothetical protein
MDFRIFRYWNLKFLILEFDFELDLTTKHTMKALSSQRLLFSDFQNLEFGIWNF